MRRISIIVCALITTAPTLSVAQALMCPTGVVVPYFGWDATACVNCAVYGSYLEYQDPPKIGSIRERGPADGKLREHDMLVSVDGHGITTPQAWHRLREARPGDTVRFVVRRDSVDIGATIVAGARCGTVQPSARRRSEGSPVKPSQSAPSQGAPPENKSLRFLERRED